MKFLKTLICVALAVVITISAFSVSAAAATQEEVMPLYNNTASVTTAMNAK